MKNLIALFLSLSLLILSCQPETPPGPTAELSIDDLSQMEGDGTSTFQFTVSLQGQSDQTVEVGFQTIEGSAKAGQDFVAIGNGRLVFPPNTSSQTLEIEVIGDTEKEEDETFSVRLTNPSGATLLKAVAEATIQNDDDGSNSTIPGDGYVTPDNYPGLTLVWADEFAGSSLNLNDWTYEIGNGDNGWGNNELQYYRAENTTLQDGHLIITAKKENSGGFQYTSSRLVTLGKKSFQYGRIDIRAVLPEGQGLWPALWMLGSNLSSAGWPACGEIDIMELVGHVPGEIHGTVHFGPSFNQHQFVGAGKSLPPGEKFSQAFHVFSIVWEEDQIKWLMDDQEFFQFTASNTNGAPYPFNQDCFFIFNVAVGGQWPGNPDASTVFPQRMIVDYVRVFQP